MKLKKVSITLVVATMFLLISAFTAQAAWFVCSVQEYGSNYQGNVMVKLTDTAATPVFADRYFFIPKGDSQKTMLATIMAADAVGKNVKVNLSGTAENSFILVAFSTSE